MFKIFGHPPMMSLCDGVGECLVCSCHTTTEALTTCDVDEDRMSNTSISTFLIVNLTNKHRSFLSFKKDAILSIVMTGQDGSSPISDQHHATWRTGDKRSKHGEMLTQSSNIAMSLTSQNLCGVLFHVHSSSNGTCALDEMGDLIPRRSILYALD